MHGIPTCTIIPYAHKYCSESDCKQNRLVSCVVLWHMVQQVPVTGNDALLHTMQTSLLQIHDVSQHSFQYFILPVDGNIYWHCILTQDGTLVHGVKVQ